MGEKDLVVSIVTKIRILKQITTQLTKIQDLKGCIYSNKDKNFKANHNVFVSAVYALSLYL